MQEHFHQTVKEYDTCRIRRLKLEAIFNCVSDGIIALNQEFQVTNFNRAAQRITGFSSTEAAGANFDRIFKPKVPKILSLIRNAIKSTKSLKDQEMEIISKLGKAKRVVLTLDVLDDASKDFQGFVLVFKDISELQRLKEEVKGKYRFGNIIGKSRAMQEIYDLILQTAATDATVFIEGESGTGKELVAQAIHYNSPRADRPFVKINCSALPETLLESELFGHVKGAFTGAAYDKIGRFEAADGGTIFLDEIGDVNSFIQLKLLRVIQEKTFEKVGSNQTQGVDLRIVSATNKDLKEEMQKGNFREDLYYRLRVVPIHLPPLRERREDIPLLVNHFIEKFNADVGKQIVRVNSTAMRAILDYNWPGNIRELENAIEHAFVRCQSKQITLGDLPKELRSLKGIAIEKGEYDLQNVSDPQEEKEIIQQALKDSSGNKTRAAKILGIGRTTLWKKIKTYQLSK